MNTLSLQTLLATFAGFFAFASGVAKFLQLEDPTSRSSRLPYIGKFLDATISSAAGGLVMAAAFFFGGVPFAFLWTLAGLIATLVVGGVGVWFERARADRRSQG